MTNLGFQCSNDLKAIDLSFSHQSLSVQSVMWLNYPHYIDVIISVMASQITGVSMVCSTVSSGVDQRKYQRSASLAFVRGIHCSPMNSPHKGPATRKCFHLMTSSWVLSRGSCATRTYSHTLVRVSWHIPHISYMFRRNFLSLGKITLIMYGFMFVFVE